MELILSASPSPPPSPPPSQVTLQGDAIGSTRHEEEGGVDLERLGQRRRALAPHPVLVEQQHLHAHVRTHARTHARTRARAHDTHTHIIVWVSVFLF